MAKVVEPKVNIVDYGPKVNISIKRNLRDFLYPSKWFKRKTVEMTPDEFVYGAATITYKDTGALQEFMELKRNDAGLEEKVKNMLVKVAGAGHASMATTPGFWTFLEGTSSKMVDSIFTSARFGSSLMPSGRRIPITIEQIVIPKGIAEKGGEAERIYLETSEGNIRAYEELQEIGIPKQEASKVVQYGHRGGGFMFMPLETLIHFSRLAEKNPSAMPLEGREIISQIESKMREMGMNTTYHARKAAPRTGAVNPNIFHFDRNFAEEQVYEKWKQLEAGKGSVLLDSRNLGSSLREDKIKNYLEKRNSLFRNPESILENGENLLEELEGIVSDFNDSVSVQTLALTPWRVWGEVKRHRTMPQTAESIYNAINRARETFRENFNEEEVQMVISLPGPVRQNKEAYGKWVDRFRDSFETYTNLLELDVEESDAVMVIPRGIKLGVVKNFDFYNLTLGYSSLRLCDTAEPEMRKITERERKLFRSSNLPDSITDLISPKCAYTGSCPELSFERSCPRVNPFIGFEYNAEAHNLIMEDRLEKIRENL